MAAIHPPSSNHYEPQARYSHCSAFVNGKIFMYGGHIFGHMLTQPPTVVCVFDPATEKWGQITTMGPPPPGFITASCTAIGVHLYIFAGWNRISFFNNIQDLNTANLKWTQLNDANQGEAPMAKFGAAMISYNEKILITIGGYGILPSHRRSGTEYIPSQNFPLHGWTNELLCFDVNSSELYVHSHSFTSLHTATVLCVILVGDQNTSYNKDWVIRVPWTAGSSLMLWEICSALTGASLSPT